MLCSTCADPNLKALSANFSKENVGEVQKLLIWRLRKDDGSLNEIAFTAAELKATYDALLAAGDDTKMQVSPTLHAATNEPGDNNTYGGAGVTAGGVEIIVSKNAGSFTGNFLMVPQSEIAKMRACSDVGVFLLNNCDQIVGLNDGATTPTLFRPIPAEAFDIGDKMIGGATEPDKNSVSFQLKSGWADNLHFINPSDFTPLTDLSNQ